MVAKFAKQASTGHPGRSAESKLTMRAVEFDISNRENLLAEVKLSMLGHGKLNWTKVHGDTRDCIVRSECCQLRADALRGGSCGKSPIQSTWENATDIRSQP